MFTRLSLDVNSKKPLIENNWKIRCEYEVSHRFIGYAKMRTLMVCFGLVIQKRTEQQQKAEVTSRGWAIGESGGVHGLPAPKILTHSFQAKFSLPAQLLLS